MVLNVKLIMLVKLGMMMVNVKVLMVNMAMVTVLWR